MPNAMSDPYHIVIADDHPLFRSALRYTLTAQLPDCSITEFDSMHELTLQSKELESADLLLLDLNMPGAHGYSGLVFVCGNYADLPVVVISANEDPVVMRQAVEYGAVGFIPKSAPSDVLSTAIGRVLAGDVYLPDAAINQRPTAPSTRELATRIASLTPHQYRVFALMREGLLNKQIAYELDVSEATIKAHVTPILRKLGVTNRTQAVLLGDQLAIAPDELLQEEQAVR